MCASVTGVRRGPVRRTEFKFQIWSVSLGVTVCIALPAGPNSLHADRSSLLSPTASPYIRPSIHLPSLPLSPPAPREETSTIHDFSYYSNKRTEGGTRENWKVFYPPPKIPLPFIPSLGQVSIASDENRLAGNRRPAARGGGRITQRRGRARGSRVEGAGEWPVRR